jgi:anti-sigma B factor antagonist
MGLTVQDRKSGGVVILSMSGRLTIGEPVLLLRNAIGRHVTEGSRKFLLDLTDVSYVDSAGLGELVATAASLRKLQGEVRLLNLSSHVKDTMMLTNLLAVFDTYTDEPIAASDFKGGRGSA